MASETDKTNEGEGNKTAAGEYNQAQRRFVKSGKVQEKAREAARALDGPEVDELAEAEAVGKSRIAEEDPQVRLDHHERLGVGPMISGRLRDVRTAVIANIGVRPKPNSKNSETPL